MLFELIAAIVAGVGGAGVMLALKKLLRGRLPRWIVPAGAGLAMIAVGMSNEYGWYDRTARSLPPQFEVTQTVQTRALYRPWTYVVPYVDRFVALDTSSVATNAAVPDQRLADIYLFQRWTAPRKVPVVADCVALRRARIGSDTTLDASGQVVDAEWIDVPADDAVLSAVCKVS